MSETEPGAPLMGSMKLPANQKALHWYVVKKSYSDSLEEGDVIGFPREMPNLSKFENGHFKPSAEWIYIGRWTKPPIDDLLEAAALIRNQKENTPQQKSPDLQISRRI